MMLGDKPWHLRAVSNALDETHIITVSRTLPRQEGGRWLDSAPIVCVVGLPSSIALPQKVRLAGDTLVASDQIVKAAGMSAVRMSAVCYSSAVSKGFSRSGDSRPAEVPVIRSTSLSIFASSLVPAL